jgi:serpin B
MKFNSSVISLSILSVGSLVSLIACRNSELRQDVPPSDAIVVDGEALSFPQQRSSVARAASVATDVPALVSGNADFAFALRSAAMQPATNTIFSPHSISTALAMARAGAVGSTGTEMDTALRFSLSGDALHQAFNALSLALAERPAQATAADVEPDPMRPALQLSWVNDAWAAESFRCTPTYLDTLARNYGLGVHIAPFETDIEASRVMINAWISAHTAARIPELLAPNDLPMSTRLVLTNAVYLNARWKNRFNPNNTLPRDFTRLDGSTVRAPMMAQSSSIPYAEGAGWAAIDLPYVGEQLSMLVMLPTAGSFESFERELTGDRYRSIVAALAARPVVVALPRFRMRTAMKLKPALRSLGMAQAFNGGDFSGITTTEAIGIEDVHHQGFIDVTEGGTEAAGATAVVFIDASVVPGPPPTVFDATRPFYFAIRDRATGALLFLGRVLDPTS